jgi:hypothetical protein
MMKLVNRLLIIAVIAFGAWFLIQHWDSAEAPVAGEENNDDGGEVVFEVQDGEEELVLDLDSDLSLEEQLEALRKKPTTTLAPAGEKKNVVVPVSETQTQTEPETIIPGGASSKVTVYLFDGGIDISNSIVSEGTVSFLVRNDGRLSHDFSIEGKEDFGRIVPGKTQTFVVDLPAGEYVVFSPRDVDQQLDMRETLIVESAE